MAASVNDKAVRIKLIPCLQLPTPTCAVSTRELLCRCIVTSSCTLGRVSFYLSDMRHYGGLSGLCHCRTACVCWSLSPCNLCFYLNKLRTSSASSSPFRASWKCIHKPREGQTHRIALITWAAATPFHQLLSASSWSSSLQRRTLHTLPLPVEVSNTKQILVTKSHLFFLSTSRCNSKKKPKARRDMTRIAVF